VFDKSELWQTTDAPQNYYQDLIVAWAKISLQSQN